MNWLVFGLSLLLVCCGMWAVLTPTLLQSAIALAASSAVLALILYELGSPLAAVFELSVCAGLITVVFVSAISLTRPGTVEAERARALTRMKRFVWLPIVLALVAAAWAWYSPAVTAINAAVASAPVREVLWGQRRFDLLGQLMLILAGVFGVVVLFKGWDTGNHDK